jgi:hypothetical protein
VQIEVMFASVPVADLNGAVEWYSRLWGRPPDVPINDDEVMWRVVDAGWLYVIRDPARAGTAVITMAVADLEASLAELTDRGIDVGPIETVRTAGRKTRVVDPDGNTIALAEIG